MMMRFLSILASFFTEYETPKIIHIKSVKVGICNRFVQLVIVCYVVIWVILLNRGYQTNDSVIYSVTSKVKGVVVSNTSVPGLGYRTWDASDYVVPPQESNAFFITTNLIVTDQSQGLCEEDPQVAESICSIKNNHCKSGFVVTHGNGVRTGRCVNSTIDTSVMVCEIYGWCPIENYSHFSRDKPILDVSNVTVLIKNHIHFPKFRVSRSNLLDYRIDRTCVYKKDDPEREFCPIFRVGDIIIDAGEDLMEMSIRGGVIAIIINWSCDLDKRIEYCVPKYHFTRLDTTQGFGKGWNFRSVYSNRHTQYYKESGVERRILTKAFGIRFIILVKGKAWKFSIIPLLQNVGSGLAILSVATVLSDLFVLYFLRHRNFYRIKKYKYLSGEDAEKYTQELEETNPN